MYGLCLSEHYCLLIISFVSVVKLLEAKYSNFFILGLCSFWENLLLNLTCTGNALWLNKMQSIICIFLLVSRIACKTVVLGGLTLFPTVIELSRASSRQPPGYRHHHVHPDETQVLRLHCKNLHWGGVISFT